MVRDLVGTVESERAEMGVLILMQQPTPGKIEAANHSGSYVAVNRKAHPKVQIITVPDLLNFTRPYMPPLNRRTFQPFAGQPLGPIK